MATQKELAAQWIAFDYRKGMASPTITPPPTKAFRRVYHMMKGKWALVAIDDQRLKISRTLSRVHASSGYTRPI